MKEYGSDFHYISSGSKACNTIKDFYPSANYYADGRQALIHLYLSQGWQRMWMPCYFCYDVIASLREAGLNLMFYADQPDEHNDTNTLETIQSKGRFRVGDAVLRINYFGTRLHRSVEKLNVPIVEDHTHDLIGDWALKSNAEWCVASLRKSLPIPEGGMLWSPIGLKLPKAPFSLEENEQVAATRWKSMKVKAQYLSDDKMENSTFRPGFVDTEEFFDRAPVCAIDKQSREYLKKFDIRNWYNKKRENWELLQEIKNDGVHILKPEGMGCYPFSMVMLFDSPDKRNEVRKKLIGHQVYPAILWNIDDYSDGDAIKFSQSMLSIHCDARYTEDDIRQLTSIIHEVL